MITIYKICIFVLLLAVLSQPGEGCVPGSEGIVTQLLAQLGISYVDGATNNTGATNSFVDAANQLNCDFENIATCRWSNLGGFVRQEIDTEDWFMFQKTADIQAFELLLPPGRSPANNGKFILSGGQGSVPKAGIWMSDPIRCMTNDAQLTFEYWIYLTSKVRAMVLDANTYEPLWTSADGACPTIPDIFGGGSVDGVCRLTIPAQNRPFRVAIQGYNFQDNFVIVDTITFSGDFGAACDGSFDFGTTESAMVSGLTGEGIATSTDLDCADPASGACKWANVGGDPDWQVHSGAVDPSKWSTATGHSTTPSPFTFYLLAGDFLMATGNDDSGAVILNSEKIDCQTGDGLLQLKAWFSTGVVVQVCVVDAATQAVQTCELLDRNAGPEYFVVIAGNLQDSFLQINADNFGTAGMAAVDDISYQAEMCAQLLITNSNTERVPYEGAPVGVITSSAELGCTVDTATACRWGAPADQQWWWLQNVDQSKLTIFSGATVTPQGGAAYFEFETDANDVTFFGSDEMYCVSSDGALQFNFWSTPNVQLEVCAILYSTDPEERPTEVCRQQGVVANQPGPVNIPFTKAELGNGREQLVFIITVYSSGKGFAMIDDLQFTGDICTEPNLTTPDEDLCLQLSSGFSEWVAWVQSTYIHCKLFGTEPPKNEQVVAVVHSVQAGETGTRTCRATFVYGIQPWEVKFTGFGEKNTRINGHAESPFPMLGVTQVQQVDANNQDIGAGISILQSEDLQFETARLVSFAYQRGTFGSQIYVCKDRVPDLRRRDIPFGDPKCTRLAGPSLSAEEWLFGAKATFTIEPTDQRIFIVGIAPWKYYYGTTHMVIDSIQVHQGTTIDSPPLCVPSD